MMRIAMGQIDPFVGDLEGNTLKICEFIERAKKANAELVIFPELSIMGYPPRDLLDKRGFVADSHSLLGAHSKRGQRYRGHLWSGFGQ